MVYGTFGYRYTIFEKPSDANSFGTAHAGENIVLIYENYNADDGIVYSLMEYDDDTKLWVNSTVTLTDGDFTTKPVVDPFKSYSVAGIHEYTVIGYWTAATTTNDKYLYRITYDPVAKEWGPPVWSSGTHNTLCAGGVKLSLDGGKVYRTTGSTLYTAYWTGSDWATASTLTTSSAIGYDLAMHANTLVYGLPNGANAVAWAYGAAEQRTWTGSGWGSVDYTFLPPARPEYARRVDDFGQSAWVNADGTLAYFWAPDSADSTNAAQANAGAYVRYTNDGGGWTYAGLTFPYKNANNNRRYGRAYLYDDTRVVYDDDTWYPVLSATNSDYGLLQLPPDYQTSAKQSTVNAAFQPKSMRAGTAVFSSNLGTYFSADTLIIYKINPGLEQDPDLVETVNPTDFPNGYFGRGIAIQGDVAAVCSANVIDGYNTAGEVFIMKQNPVSKQWTKLDSIGPIDDPTDTNIGFCQGGISFDGSTVLVPVLSRVVDSVYVGGLYVFDFDGTTLTHNTILDSPDPKASTGFPGVVKVVGDNILSSSYQYDLPGESNIGMNVMYNKVGGVWDAGTVLPFPTENVILPNDQFGRGMDFDGTRAVIGASGFSTGPSGLFVLYEWNGTAWDVMQEIRPESSTASSGTTCAISGNFFACSSSTGVFSMYELIGGTWTFKEFVEPTNDRDSLYPTYFADAISISGNVMVVGYDADAHTGYNSGSVRVFIYDGSTWVGNGSERTITLDSSNKGVSFAAYGVSTDGSNLITSAIGYDSITNNNVGKMYSLSLFETCTVSADCSNPSNYCSPDDLCVEPKACTTVSDCLGEFKAGRVAYCGPVSGFCRDRYAGTCTTAEGCRIKARQGRKTEAGIASAKTQISSTDSAKTKTATKDMISRTKDSVTNPDDLLFLVTGTETKEFTPEDVALDPNFADKVKAARCQDAVESCEVTTSGGRRLDEHGRLLQVDNITITITYTLDDAAYNATFDFDDPDFLQALADSIGVNVTDIDVTGDASGNVEIEVTLTDESNGQDPLSEDLISQIEDISASMDSIGDDLVAELGLDPADIEQQALDLCVDRTCTGRGTCDENTGVCDCDGDWWGIDCETACSCENEGTCNGGYCVCAYPFYGQRCVDEVDCSC